MRVNVLQAAKLLAEMAASENISDLTPLKLQKILYYIEGWYLGNGNDDLFYETPLAWKYGPVYKEVYTRFRGQDPSCVTAKNFSDVDSIDIDSELNSAIKAVWDEYKNKTAAELVALSHETAPWLDAWNDPWSDVINKNLMRWYFSRLVNQ